MKMKWYAAEIFLVGIWVVKDLWGACSKSQFWGTFALHNESLNSWRSI